MVDVEKKKEKKKAGFIIAFFSLHIKKTKRRLSAAVIGRAAPIRLALITSLDQE